MELTVDLKNLVAHNSALNQCTVFVNLSCSSQVLFSNQKFQEADTEYRRPPWYDYITKLACWERNINSGCFCMSYHAVASNHHLCNCWAPPTALFLVCRYETRFAFLVCPSIRLTYGHRIMRQDALKVFFNQNRYVVAPEGGGIGEGGFDPVSTSPTTLPITTFLQNVVPKDALQHLRYLEILFP